MSRRTFVELLKERAWGPSFGLEQDAHDVIELLPTVHGFLVILPSLQDHLVYETDIRDMSVLFEPRTDALPKVRYRYIQRVD